MPSTNNDAGSSRQVPTLSRRSAIQAGALAALVAGLVGSAGTVNAAPVADDLAPVRALLDGLDAEQRADVVEYLERTTRSTVDLLTGRLAAQIAAERAAIEAEIAACSDCRAKEAAGA